MYLVGVVWARHRDQAPKWKCKGASVPHSLIVTLKDKIQGSLSLVTSSQRGLGRAVEDRDSQIWGE